MTEAVYPKLQVSYRQDPRDSTSRLSWLELQRSPGVTNALESGELICGGKAIPCESCVKVGTKADRCRIEEQGPLTYSWFTQEVAKAPGTARVQKSEPRVLPFTRPPYQP